MNYIYDIYLNFTNLNSYLKFFEWDDDLLINYIKIPLIKTSKKILNDFYKNKIKIDDNIYKKIINKSKADNFKTYTSFIIADEEYAFACMFDKDRNLIKRSELLLEDLDDVIEISSKYKNIKINYLKQELTIEQRKNTIFELNVKKYLDEQINLSYKKNKLKLKFMYNEIFEKNELDINIIYKELKESLNNIDNSHINLYNLLTQIKSKN